MADRPDPLGYFHRWAEVRAGSTEHSPENFMFFLNDLHPNLFEKLIADLPAGDQFIARLNRMIADHHDLADLDVSVAGCDHNQLTMRPREGNRVLPDELVAIARRDVTQRVQLCRHFGEHEQAELWDVNEFVFLDGDSAESVLPDDGSNDELIDDLLAGAYTERGNWLSCLQESAYHLIGNDYALHPWIFRQWLDVPIDFEPTYELWKANGSYQFVDGVCFVYHRT